MERVLTGRFDVEGASGIETARAHGAYLSLKRLGKLSRAQVVDLVAKSGHRERCGSGSPLAERWARLSSGSGSPAHLIVNAEENEPGSFKDRMLVERDPHLVIEGLLIAAHAVGARHAYVCFRGEDASPMRTFSRALEEARAAGIFDGILDGAIVHRGAGTYICGEESALIDSIESGRGAPKFNPKRPEVDGLYGAPTVVHDAETLASLPFIVREGAKAFASLGTDRSTGTKLVSLSGAVARPGVYEVEMGTPLSMLLNDEAGGMEEGRSLKALMPGGISNAVLTASEALSCAADFESLTEAGSSLGSGSMIAIDEGTSMVEVLSGIARFFARESCGKCSPCREGSGWVKRILGRMERGEGRRGDIYLLNDLSLGMAQTSLCPLARSLAIAILSFTAKFRREFETACSA